FNVYEISSRSVIYTIPIESNNFQAPAWLHDGTGLVYLNPEMEIVLFDLASQTSRSFPNLGLRGFISYPNFGSFVLNPINSRLIYVQSPSDSTELSSNIYMLDLQSGESTHILEISGREPNLLQWSPDGRYFVFTDREPHLINGN